MHNCVPMIRIIIPAHNEERRIAGTLDDYCFYFGDRATILVVTNGCTDGTLGVVQEMQRRYPNLKVLDIPSAIGKGGAVRAGLSTGLEPYVGFADADHSTSAREFDKLFDKCAREGLGGVIASRWLAGAIVHPRQPLFRRFASRVFNRIVRLLLGLPFTDTQCGAKVFSREAVQAVLENLEIADFSFDIDLLLQLTRSGYKIKEVPTEWRDEPTGTKVRLFNTSRRMFMAALRLRLRHSVLRNAPFIDLLARSSVMPVSGKMKILILGNPRRLNKAAADLVRSVQTRLEEDGHVVRWARSPFWRFFIDYIRRDHAVYDGIIEVASNRPWLVPLFSRKPTFIVGAAECNGRLAGLMYPRCRNSIFVEKCTSLPSRYADRLVWIGYDLESVECIVSLLKFNRLYPAHFEYFENECRVHVPAREDIMQKAIMHLISEEALAGKSSG